MATRKKKTEEKIIAEVSKLIAEETLQATDTPKKKKAKTEEVWPKVVVGSHLTVTTYPDGRTELEWDDEALLRDVKQAIEDYEMSQLKPAVKAKVATRKKKNASV